MTVSRDRLMSAGDVTWIDIIWDSPMGVEQPDGSVIEGDPNASQKIEAVVYQNLSARTFTVNLWYFDGRQRTYTLAPNTAEFQNNIPNPQRPTMSEIRSFSMEGSPMPNASRA